MQDQPLYPDKPDEALDIALLFPAIRWVAEQIPGGFFIYRAEGAQELLFINSAALGIFGCATREEFAALTGDTFPGMVHPEDYAATVAAIDRQIGESGDAGLDYVEYRIVRRDGAVRWVDDYGHRAVLPGYGDVYYVFIVDITEMHLAREEDRRRANVYTGMIDQFNALAEDSLSVFRASMTTEKILEVQGRDLYPTDFAGADLTAYIRARADNLLLEGDRERFLDTFRVDRMMERYFKGEGPATFVGYCRRASGRQCFVKFSGSAVIDPVTGDTITFGIETEYNAGRVEEVLHEKVLASQYDMVTYLVGHRYGVVIGDAGSIRRGSIFPEEREGSYSEYIERQVLPAAAPQDREALRRALALETVTAELGKREPYAVDVACEIGGSVYHKRFTFYAVDQDTQFYILLKSDMTDILRAERERSQLLTDALRDAERANAATTAFLSNMSHEIRTPLNAIIGLDAIALEDAALPAQTRERLEKIGDSAKQLLGILNDVLDVSRIESGKLLLQSEEFSLRELLEQLQARIGAQCADKGLTFDARVIGAVSERFIGDAGKLTQVLENILSNAVRFTEAPGTVRFTAEQAAVFGENATLRFVISDTGIGIDSAFLPHIFDAFAQETVSESGGTAGLGMTITKHIVEAMNGTIAVESEKGAGSTFTVTVTLRSCAPACSSPVSARTALEGRRILLAEDMEINAEIVTDILRMRGMEVDCGENGQVTLDLFAASPEGYYDAVLMDIRMPVMDGLAAARAIRALDRPDAAAVPIIALTANAFDEDMQNSLQAGMNAHLTKPVDPYALYEALETLIGAREAS